MLKKFMLSLAILASCIAALSSATPLDDYVNMPDPTYKYELLQTQKLTGYTLYTINMTSQKWLDGTASSCLTTIRFK